MKVVFKNLNNNDVEHNIIFLHITKYASGVERIAVSIDGSKYSTRVHFDEKGRRSFKHCGKTYVFEVENE